MPSFSFILLMVSEKKNFKYFFENLPFKTPCQPIWQNFELDRDVMDVLATSKYEEDPIKNEGARVLTTLYSNFSDAQRQITL